MARPIKRGLSYFPVDIGWRKDRKVRLLEGEFGSKSLIVLLALWELCYKDHGYYTEWQDEDAILLSQDLSGDYSVGLIQEIVSGCLRRSLFDQGVFQAFGVLTSAAVQKRYLMAIKDNVIKSAAASVHREFKPEFWLLTEDDLQEVFGSRYKQGLVKFTQNDSFSGINSGFSGINPGFSENNSPKQDKTRQDETKPDETMGVAAAGVTRVFRLFESIKGMISSYEQERLMELMERYSDQWVYDALKVMADAGRTKLGYAESILERWQAEGRDSKPTWQAAKEAKDAEREKRFEEWHKKMEAAGYE